VALFEGKARSVRVFFDQTPAAVLGIPTEYGRVVGQYRGISGGERRPDILLVAESEGRPRLVLVEMKKTADGRYMSDSIYKVFAYLYDFKGSPSERAVKAVLVVPTGVSTSPGAPVDRAVFVASADDRGEMARTLGNALND